MPFAGPHAAWRFSFDQNVCLGIRRRVRMVLACPHQESGGELMDSSTTTFSTDVRAAIQDAEQQDRRYVEMDSGKVRALVVAFDECVVELFTEAAAASDEVLHYLTRHDGAYANDMRTLWFSRNRDTHHYRL